MSKTRNFGRRQFAVAVAASAAMLPVAGLPVSASPAAISKRPIPASGELIPILGMGTWITFNVGPSERLRKARAHVLQSFFDREAEDRLLPLAADQGIAIIVNRPFRRSGAFEHVAGHPVPDWAAEFGADTWAQFFLKFVLSHPSVTCAIPATSKVDHMVENMAAARGPMPDEAMRQRMINHIERL